MSHSSKNIPIDAELVQSLGKCKVHKLYKKKKDRLVTGTFNYI